MPLSLRVLSNFSVVENAVTQNAMNVFVGTAERWIDNEVMELMFILHGHIKLQLHILNEKKYFLFMIEIYS